jgi:hypothetical protein
MRALIVLALALALAPAAAAAPAKPVGPIFGVRAIGNPKLGYFVYPANAGSVLHGAVAVTNTGDRAGSVKLYSADATTGATSGTVYLTDNTPAGVGTWISLGSHTLTLKPSQRTTVPFTVHVPAGSRAGDFVGGIVAETVLERQGPQSANKTNVQIKVRNLSIVAVEVNVPGPRVSKFTIGAANVGGSKGRQQLFLHISNDGNVLTKPKGSVTVQSSAGTPIETIAFKMDSFLPHTAIDYPVQLKEALPPGGYVASVRLTYPGTGAAGAVMSSGAPQFTVSKENVQKVFKPGKPTVVGPGGVVAASGGGSSLYKWLAIGFGALLLGGGGYFFAVIRQRRPVTVPATPVPPAPPVAGPPEAASSSASEPTLGPCQGYHYWQADWMHGQLGPDGVLLYPHRCRNCGIEVRAADIGDAAKKAAALEP